MAWAPRASGIGMRWDINLGEVAQMVGTIYGVTNTVKTTYYIDALMRHAHADAAKQFDIDMAAQATATQMYNHMYEWGTAGINKGRTTRRMSPTNPEAKLWKHKLSGGRSRSKGIDFTFRASKVPVPQPTTAKTKVAREHLDRLSGRKHIFFWKAPIIESGMKVKLRPKYAKVIFVPFYGKPRSPSLTAGQRKRGFLYHKGPLTNVPGHGTIQGRDLAGNFTTYWELWWNSSGSQILDDRMNTAVTTQVAEALERAGKKGTRTRGKKWQFDIITAERETEQFLESRAKALAQQAEMEGELW